MFIFYEREIMGDMNLLGVILSIVFYMIALLIATIGREIFRGLMALRYGDETPRIAQRITLNPLKHLDIFGTILIPFALIIMGANFIFGYAKPMPINFTNIQQQTGFKGCVYVALSGTFFNLFNAFFFVVLIKLMLQYNIVSEKNIILQFLIILVYVNIIIAIFNLLPLPPFDGAKILAYLGLWFNIAMFARWYNNLEKYGMILIILVLLLPPTRNGIMWIVQNVVMMFLQL